MSFFLLNLDGFTAASASLYDSTAEKEACHKGAMQ